MTDNNQTEEHKVYDSKEDYKPLPLRDFVLQAVETGIKGVELVAQTTAACYENVLIQTKPKGKFVAFQQEPVKKYKREAVIDLINRMVKEGDLVEIEFVLPTMDYRVKSYYFPRGTKLNIIRHDKIVGV